MRGKKKNQKKIKSWNQIRAVRLCFENWISSDWSCGGNHVQRGPSVPWRKWCGRQVWQPNRRPWQRLAAVQDKSRWTRCYCLSSRGLIRKFVTLRKRKEQKKDRKGSYGSSSQLQSAGEFKQKTNIQKAFHICTSLISWFIRVSGPFALPSPSRPPASLKRVNISRALHWNQAGRRRWCEPGSVLGPCFTFTCTCMWLMCGRAEHDVDISHTCFFLPHGAFGAGWQPVCNVKKKLDNYFTVKQETGRCLLIFTPNATTMTLCRAESKHKRGRGRECGRGHEDDDDETSEEAWFSITGTLTLPEVRPGSIFSRLFSSSLFSYMLHGVHYTFFSSFSFWKLLMNLPPFALLDPPASSRWLMLAGFSSRMSIKLIFYTLRVGGQQFKLFIKSYSPAGTRVKRISVHFSVICSILVQWNSKYS